MCGMALIPASLVVVRVDMKHLWLHRHFLPDLVLQLRRKTSPGGGRLRFPGKLGAGVISSTAALLNPAAAVLTLSLSPLNVTQLWHKGRAGNVLISQETEVNLLQLPGIDGSAANLTCKRLGWDSARWQVISFPHVMLTCGTGLNSSQELAA